MKIRFLLLFLSLIWQFSNYSLFAQTGIKTTNLEEVKPKSSKNYNVKELYEVDSPAIGDKLDCEGNYDQSCLMNYIFKELKVGFVYPLFAKLNRISGKSYIQFIINKRGKVVDVQVAKSSGYNVLDKMALWLIQSLPKFDRAAMLNGKPVATRITIPVVFKLQSPAESEVLRLGDVDCPPEWSLDWEYRKDKINNDKMTYFDKMTKFRSNFKYPPMAKDQNQQGRVYVEYVVSKTGEIVDVKVVKSSGYKLLDAEGVKLVNRIPDMVKPAMKDGMPVNFKFTVPITFRLTY